MKVKVLRGYLGKEGRTHSGQLLDISEMRFRQLTDRHNPLVAAVDVGYKMQEKLQNKMETAPRNKRRTVDLAGARALREAGPIRPADAQKLESKTFEGKDVYDPRPKEAAKAAPVDPTPSPSIGGQTGAESAASSSEPVPARTKRKYTKRAAKPESSPSIGPGNWRHGRIVSTPATSRGGRNTKASRPSKG